MALYLICGTAGSGKTQVCHALKDRGYEAYDTDDDGLARWQHNETGYVHPKSSVKSHMRTAEFLENHSWNVPVEHVKEWIDKAKDHDIFICGALGNEYELYGLFKAVFALYVDDDTLAHRLATRRGNDWGKQAHELELTLHYHRSAYEKYQKRGYIIVDATQPVEQAVDEILSKINTRQ